jgi:anti-anti-sigma regulatory factor
MGLDIPGLARRGIAIVPLRGVLGEASALLLTGRLCRVFAADPHLLIIDLAGLRGWDETGQHQLAGVSAYLAARGGRMVLSAGGHT